MTAPIRTMFAAGLIALASLAAPAAADKTTLGLEWENSRVKIDLTEVAELAQDPDDPAVDIPFYKTTVVPPQGGQQRAVETRILCTDDSYAAKRFGYPLVSMTWDMGRLRRTLEIVTQPLDRDDNAGWDRARDFIERFHRELDAACMPTSPYHHISPGVHRDLARCEVPVSDMLALMNQAGVIATTACYGNPAKDAQGTDQITFLVREIEDDPDHLDVSGNIHRFNDVKPQVSVGLDLEHYTSDFGAFFVSGTQRIGRRAWDRFRTGLAPGANGLTAAQKGFAGIYFVQLHALFDYLYASSTGQKDTRRGYGATYDATTPATHLSAKLAVDPISDDDAVYLKNSFGVLVKTRIDDLYDHLVGLDPNFAAALFNGRDAAYFCDATLLGNDAQKISACEELHDTFWKQKVISQGDPLSLKKIAGSVAPVITNQGDGKVRIVVEVRGSKPPPALVASRMLKWAHPFHWAAPLPLPAFLP